MTDISNNIRNTDTVMAITFSTDLDACLEASGMCMQHGAKHRIVKLDLFL